MTLLLNFLHKLSSSGFRLGQDQTNWDVKSCMESESQRLSDSNSSGWPESLWSRSCLFEESAHLYTEHWAWAFRHTVPCKNFICENSRTQPYSFTATFGSCTSNPNLSICWSEKLACFSFFTPKMWTGSQFRTPFEHLTCSWLDEIGRHRGFNALTNTSILDSS